MYRLLKAEKGRSGIIRHEVNYQGGDNSFLYRDLRFALVWPTAKSPAYFVGGGSEVYDEQLTPHTGEIIRLTAEHEHQGIDLDSFFDTLTDHMTSQLASTVYCDLSKEDHKQIFYSYVDRRGLRNISAQQAPYFDLVLRLGVLKDFDQGGRLVIARDSPLFGDLQGIARLDLQDEPEIRFYRLNCLSMLIAGYSKYPSTPPLTFKFRPTPGGSMSWAV